MRLSFSWLLILAGLLCSSGAWAADPLVANLSAGMVGAHPGTGVEVWTGVSIHRFYARVEAGAFVRYVIANDLPVAAATGTLGLSRPFVVGRAKAATLGPVVMLDGLLVSQLENRCHDNEGCRFEKWIGLDQALLALEPAVGLEWHTHAEDHYGKGMDLSLAWQSTAVFDVYLPLLPRMEVGVRLGRGWRVGVEAQRFGARMSLGRAL